MYASILRYSADFSSGFLILGTLAHWEVSRKLSPSNQKKKHRVWSVVVVSLSIASVLIGILLSFGGETVIFELNNPALMTSIRSLFD